MRRRYTYLRRDGHSEYDLSTSALHNTRRLVPVISLWVHMYRRWQGLNEGLTGPFFLIRIRSSATCCALTIPPIGKRVLGYHICSRSGLSVPFPPMASCKSVSSGCGLVRDPGTERDLPNPARPCATCPSGFIPPTEQATIPNNNSLVTVCERNLPSVTVTEA